ncbi:Uncharacterised protein [uncultured Clostridium sp.]|nr:Uncharacterised protein [uncultured Clostridium sp.]
MTGCSITAKYKRADGQVINGSVINISNNSFDAVIDSDITKVVGTLKMLFSIEKDDVKVSTFLLLADVREGLLENTGSSGGSTGGGEVTVDLSNYYKKNETYSKAQIDSQFKDITNEKIDNVTLSDNVLTFFANSKTIKTITLPTSTTGGGTNGKEIELQKSTTHIQWRYVGDTDWTNLVALVDLKGNNGLSAYELAQEQGFGGNVGQWLQSLVPNLQIGTVETLDSGSNAIASITGTVENPLLNLGIPKGENGTGGSSDTLVTTNISGATLSLTTDKYQTATVVDGTEITLPTVTSFTEIHLFFNTTADLTLILPACKWQNGNTPTISASKTYEFIFTYTTEWLGGVIAYE